MNLQAHALTPRPGDAAPPPLVTLHALILYFGAVLVLGAMLAPPLYWALQRITAAGLLSGLADTPFRRVANRSFMVVALFGLWPLGRVLNCWRRRELGYGVSWRRGLLALGVGVIFGVVSMAPLYLLQYRLRLRYLAPAVGVEMVVDAFLSGLLTGLLVSLIEETFVRGFLYSAWRRAGPVVAIGFTSIFYALVHFLRSEGQFDQVAWNSGFAVLQQAFGGVLEMAHLGPFLALAGVGVFLGLLREELGHIVLGLGIHAGWVAMIKTWLKISDIAGDHRHVWLLRGYDNVNSYLSAIYLLLLIGALLLGMWWRRKRAPEEPVAESP